MENEHPIDFKAACGYINRRTFLKKAGNALAAGLATGHISPPISEAIVKGTEKLTGLNAGNAGTKDLIKTHCSNETGMCEKKHDINLLKKTEIVLTPIIEEALFRALPSLVADEEDVEWIKPTLIGQETKLTKKEWAIGAVSSLLFASAHNVTKEGFDNKTLPTYAIAFGMAYWYLQRKFGFVSNTTAHMLHNLFAVNTIKQFPLNSQKK